MNEKVPNSQISCVHLNKPQNEVETEKAFLQMAKIKLNTNSFRRFGRKGQIQYGIDHTGYENDDSSKLVVLQSKCRGPDKKEAPGDIREHLEYWLGTKIKFSKFIYCTTADPDQKFHRAALEATQWLAEKHKINALVLIWDWGNIQDECDANSALRKIWDPEYVSKDEFVARELSGVREDIGIGLDAIQSQLQTGINQILSENDRGGNHDTAIDLLNDDVESRPMKAIEKADKILKKSGLNKTDISRLLAIKGNAFLQLGENSKAIEFYKAAYKETPDRPNTAANYALSLGLSKEIKELQKFAAEKILQFPDNEMLVARCAYFLKDLGLIPESLSDGPSLSAMKLELQRLEMDKGTHRLRCEEAYQRFNDHTHRTILSVAIMDELSEKKTLHPASFWDASDKQLISKAINLLEQNFEAISAKGNCYNEKDLADVTNLTIACRLAGMTERSLEVAKAASLLNGGENKFDHIISVSLADLGRHAEALAVLSDSERNSNSIQMEISILLQEQNWEKLIEVCDNYSDLLEPRMRPQANAIRNISTILMKPVEAHDELLKDLFSSDIGSALEVAIYAQVAQKHGLIDDLLPVLERLKNETCSTENNEDDRLILSKIFRDLHDEDAVFDLLLGHVPFDTYSQPLRLLAESAAYEYPVRDRDKRLFDEISDEVLEQPSIKYLLGVFHFNNSNIEKASSIFTSLNSSDRRLKYITWICRCAFRQRDYKLISTLLKSSDIVKLPGSASNCLELAGHANREGMKELSTLLGMRAIQNGYDSPEITSGFTTLMMMNHRDIPENLVVSDRVFVSISRQGDDPLQGIVGASEDRPWANALDPNVLPLIKAALGKRVGDEVSIRTGLGKSEPWKISAVQPEWLRATQFLMKEHEQHFGDQALMMRFSVSEEDLSPILDQLSEAERRFEDLCQVISEQNIPMRLLSGDRPFGAVGLAEQMRQTGKVIPTAFGRPMTTQKSIDATIEFAENGKGAVIDMFTAITAAELNLLTPMKKLFGNISIPLDDIERFEADLERPNLIPFGEIRAASIAGELRVWKREKSDLESSKSIALELLNEIKGTCDVVNFVFPDPKELDEELNYFANFSPETIAPLLLAKDKEAILISDDRAIRKMAKELLNVDSTWLQFCSLHCLSKGIITRIEQLRVSCKLVEYGHMFYYVTVRDLYDSARLQLSGELTREFDVFASRLGDDDISDSSRIEVTANFIRLKLLGHKWTVDDAAQCGTILREHFRNASSEKTKQEIGELKKRLALDPLKYVEQWAVGHLMGLS